MRHKTGARSRTALVGRAYGLGILTMGEQGLLATGRRLRPVLNRGAHTSFCLAV